MSTAWPFAAGFVVCAIVVPLMIGWQRRKRIGQQVYEDGPKAHAVKQGTPTMGGFAFLIAALAGLIFSHNTTDVQLLLLVGGAGIIGALDDVLTLFNRRALGLRARWKFALLALLAVAYLALLQSGADPLGYDEVWPGAGIVTLSPWLWWFLSLAAIVGAANAVNLTDGLDGLATGTIIPPLLVLSLGALSAPSIAVLGACAAFLYFNWHPAKVFMGDAGSLLLGALLAGDAIQMHWLLLLPLLGLVFVAEALSVIAQVASFKLTRRRIFKMSPLHHHFELSGWSERRIAWTFILVSILATGAALFAMSNGVAAGA
jgi:phospho-N-acetylmuramoyl-pentapeptide-transferase